MTRRRKRSSKAVNRCVTALESLRTGAAPRFGIDSRALGAFRIALGVLLLADLLFLRVPGLGAFYTDDGVFPRSALAESYPTLAAASIHAVSGSAWVQGVLFGIAGCFAVFLLVGYRTRISLAVSLLLLASLYARNPHVVNGGDTVLLTFLFLGLFLPLDERWSLGGGRRTDDDRCVRSLGTAVLLSHIVIVYAVNAIHKYRSDPWMAGTAVPRIFQLEEYVVLLGPYLAEHSTLLATMNWLWIALHSVAAFLLLYTGWPRTALAAAFVCVHLGTAATMRLGIFPFVMIAGLLLFFPSPVWDRIDALAGEVWGRIDGLAGSIGDRTDGVVREVAQKRTRSPASAVRSDGNEASGPIATASAMRSPRVRRGVRAGRTAVLVGFFVTIVCWHAAGGGLVDPSPPDLDGGLSDASWAFFAPNPPDTSNWYVVEATLESGETIDAADGGAVSLDRPPDVADTYPTTLWHRYGLDVRYADETHYEPAAAYVCQNLDRDVESVTIYHVEQPVGPDGPVGDPTPKERITSTC